MAPTPQLHTRGVDFIVPEIWVAQLETGYDVAARYTQPGIMNRRYEGQLQQAGDTVHLFGLVSPTTWAYDVEMDIPDPNLETVANSFTVDQARGFSFRVNDIDVVRSFASGDDLEGSATQLAVNRIVDDVETYVAAKISKNAGTRRFYNLDTAGNSFYNMLVDAWSYLDQKTKGNLNGALWFMIPPLLANFARKDEQFQALTDKAGQFPALFQGQIGSCAGFSIIVSHRVPTDRVNKTIDCHFGVGDGGMTFVNQMTSFDAVKMERKRATLVSGIYVYDAAILRPTDIGVFRVSSNKLTWGILSDENDFGDDVPSHFLDKDPTKADNGSGLPGGDIEGVGGFNAAPPTGHGDGLAEPGSGVGMDGEPFTPVAGQNQGDTVYGDGSGGNGGGGGGNTVTVTPGS